MKQSPKKTGAAKEPIQSMAPKSPHREVQDRIDAMIENMIEKAAEPKSRTSKRDALKPKEIGMPIFAHMPSRSKMARKQAVDDYKAGKVQNMACMLLPDGQVICAGSTVKTVMSEGIKAMARSGKLIVGKALKGAKVRGRA